MAMRIDETISGVKADLAIKVFGDDFGVLDAIGQQVLRAVSAIAGAADAQMEITSGVAELSVQVDRAALARYGLNVTDVEQAVASGGSGDVISEVIDGEKRYTRGPTACPNAIAPIQMQCARSCCGRRAVNRSPSIRWRGCEVRRGPELINREEGSGELSSCQMSEGGTLAVSSPMSAPK